MNKQMFVDESEASGQLFIVSGAILNLEDVELLSKEWWKLLPKGQELSKDGRRKSKRRDSPLAEQLYMQSIPYIHAVYDVAIPVKAYKAEFARMKERVALRNKILMDVPFWDALEPEAFNQWSYRYMSYIACCSFFGQLQVKFASAVQPGLSEPVDITFDRFSDPDFQDKIRQGFEVHRETVPPGQRSLMGQPPQFEDSKNSPPVQFADLWAWWRRKTSLKDKKFDGSQNPIPWGKQSDVLMLSTAWKQEDIRDTFDKKLDMWLDLCPRVIRPRPAIILPRTLLSRPAWTPP